MRIKREKLVEWTREKRNRKKTHNTTHWSTTEISAKNNNKHNSHRSHAHSTNIWHNLRLANLQVCACICIVSLRCKLTRKKIYNNSWKIYFLRATPFNESLSFIICCINKYSEFMYIVSGTVYVLLFRQFFYNFFAFFAIFFSSLFQIIWCLKATYWHFLFKSWQTN